ncbi:TonB-dependent receptor [Dyella koreensis]|uniref:TonB-dependent receptor n=1 Tax=Dyella koreensis TaxID=311235 RepID=A0ABW8JZN7_9GAMM
MQRHILAGSIHQALFVATVIACVATGNNAYAQDANASATAPAASQGTAADPAKEKKDGKEVVQLNGVSVTGQLASIRRAQAIKQDATGVVDAVSAEEAGKFPDPNVADALQRVPGVAVDRGGGESSRITVRGFGPDFVNVLLNGRTMATDATDRAFNFDILPSQLISTAEVRKTASADVAEGGIGGTVNIITARPLDLKGFHVSASVAGVNDSLKASPTGGITPRASVLLSNTNADGTFGWLIAGMYDRRDHREQSMNTSGWITGLNYSQINPAYTNIALPQTLSGSDYMQTRTRRGISGAIDWKPIENLTVKLDTMISNYKIDSKYHAFGSYMNTSDVQALTADGNGTALSYTRGNTGVLANDYIEESNPRNAYNEQTGLNIAYQINNSTVIDWDTAVSRAWNKESANGYFFVVGTRNVGVNPVWTNNGSSQLPSYSNLISTTDTSNLRAHCCSLGGESPNVSDRILQSKLHLGKSFTDGVLAQLDFGVEGLKRTKTEVTWRSPNSLLCGEYCGYVAAIPGSAINARIYNAGTMVDGISPGYPTQWLTYDVPKLLAYLASPAAYNQLPNAAAFAAKLAANGGGFTARPDASSYSQVEERTKSAYGKANFQGNLMAKPWTLEVGLRYSKTDTTSRAYSVPLEAITINPNDTSNAIPTYGSLAPVSATGSYSNWLPSANFKWSLRDDIIFRAAVSKTVTRPDLSNLSAATSYNFRPATQGVTEGNTELKPYTSKNYDLGLEWYLSDTSYLAIGGFEKKVSNFTTLVTTKTTILGFPFDLTRPINLNSATIKGVEAAATYQFTWLPAPFDGLGASANYTHVTSSASAKSNDVGVGGKFAVPGIGDSANVSGYYEKGPFQVRLAYNWRDAYLETISGDESQPTTVKAYGQLDMSASYKLMDNVSLFFDATNLTREKVSKYQVYLNRPSYAEINGRTLSAGIRASW